MTIGMNYVWKIQTIDNVKIKLQIWDTAGQERYKTITQNYYKNSDGAIIGFSIDSLQSFYSVSMLLVIQGTGQENLMKQFRPISKYYQWEQSAIYQIKDKQIENKLRNSRNKIIFNTWNAVPRVDSL